MLRIKNRHVDWEQHQIAIPGSNAKDAENRRIPFDPHGRLAPILKRRSALGPNAFVFGSSSGEFLKSFKTAWESLLLLLANGHDTKRAKPGATDSRTADFLRKIGAPGGIRTHGLWLRRLDDVNATRTSTATYGRAHTSCPHGSARKSALETTGPRPSVGSMTSDRRRSAAVGEAQYAGGAPRGLYSLSRGRISFAVLVSAALHLRT